MNDIVQVFEDRLGAAYSAMYPGRFLDPVTIGILVNIAFDLMDRCKKAKEEKLARRMKNPKRRHKVRGRKAVEHKFPSWSDNEVSEGVEMMFKISTSASDEERLQMIQAVRAED